MDTLEQGLGVDKGLALALAGVGDKGRMKARWIIEKFHGDFKKRPSNVKPFEVLEFEFNLLLNEGINELWTLLCGTGATKFDNANAYIGVGNGATLPSDPTVTDLQGASKTYKAMDTSYPTYGSSQKATWRSTFGSGDANYAWEEITVANGSSGSAKNLNRKVQSMGTKASGSTWIATLEITLS
jgi:hypothetical protein